MNKCRVVCIVLLSASIRSQNVKKMNFIIVLVDWPIRYLCLSIFYLHCSRNQISVNLRKIRINRLKRQKKSSFLSLSSNSWDRAKNTTKFPPPHMTYTRTPMCSCRVDRDRWGWKRCTHYTTRLHDEPQHSYSPCPGHCQSLLWWTDGHCATEDSLLTKQFSL